MEDLARAYQIAIILVASLLAGAGSFGVASSSYNGKIGQLQNEVDSQREMFAEVQKSLMTERELTASLKKDLQGKDLALNASVLRFIDLTKAYDATQTQIKEISGQKFQLENQKVETETRLSTITQERDNLQNQIAVLNRQSESLQKNLTSLQTNLASLRVSLTKQIQNNTELQNRYSLSQRQKSDVERSLVDLQAQVVNLNSQIASLNNQIGSLNSQINSLNARISQLTAQNAILQQQVNSLQAQVSSLEPDALKFRNLSPVSYTRITARPVVYFDKYLLAPSRAWCTGSMGLTLGCNDITILYKPAPNEVNIGHIIVFKAPKPDCSGYQDSTIIHRILGITTQQGTVYFQTKGDANAFPDPCRIPFDAILYKVIGIIYDATLP